MTGIRPSRILWIGAAAILVAAALVALTAVLRGDFSDTDARILGTLAAALLAGSTAVAGLALSDRGSRLLGSTAILVAATAFAALVYGIWDSVFDAGDDWWRWAWTGALALVAMLVATTARLLARAPWIVRLARGAGVLASVAAAVSIWALWSEGGGDAAGRAVAALWIVTALAYFLVPVLERFTTAGEDTSPRVLGELDGVELVASKRLLDGLSVELPGRGERLVLRRRP